MKDDFAWHVPVESVPVPSEGRLYPPSSALHLKNSIDIKAMTAREEDILSSRALMQRGESITYLIKSCVMDKKIDPDEMLVGDRNSLMVAIRITGYGTDYNVSVDCPECSAKNHKTFNLGDLEIKRLEIDPVQPGTNLFSYRLPVSKKEVLFQFLTTGAQTNMSLTNDRRKKLFPDDAVGNTVTSRLESCIVSIDGVKDKNKIASFIKNMPALDSRRLRNYIDAKEPGIEMKSWMTCDNCGAQSSVDLPITTEFFWPRE